MIITDDSDDIDGSNDESDDEDNSDVADEDDDYESHKLNSDNIGNHFHCRHKLVPYLVEKKYLQSLDGH